MRVCAVVCLTSFLVLWLGFILILDAAFAASLHPWLYLYLTTVTLLIVLCLCWIVGRNLTRFCLLLFLAPLIILPFVDLSPVKPFYRFYRSIRIGMSDAEVNDLLVKYFPEKGLYRRPVRGHYGGGGPCFILDPNDGRYNAEIIVVKTDNGRLSSKRYLPD